MEKNNLTSMPRQRTSVAIQGLDISTPDDIVVDGKCEKLHNMRYNAEAWRPVHEHKTIATITSPSPNMRIVYKHPAAEGDKYIALIARVSTLQTTYSYVDYDITTNNYTTIHTSNSECEIYHFGNVLFLREGTAMHRYLLHNGTYKVYSITSAPTIAISDLETNYHSLPDFFRLSADVGPNDLFKADTWYSADRLGEALKTVRDWNVSIDGAPVYPQFTCLWLLSDADKLDSCIPLAPNHSKERSATSWHGEIALFAAYHTASGDVVSPSPLHLCVSDNALPLATFEQQEFFHLYKSDVMPDNDPNRRYIGCQISFDYSVDLSVATIRERCPYSYILPSLSINIDSRLNTNFITGVAIYATRINPIFDASLYVNRGNTIPYNKLWAQNNLPEQPFYLVKEFPLDADVDNDYADHYTLSLDSLLLQQAIHNKVYTPSVTHDIYGDATLDYNNALHMGGIHTSFKDDGILSDALVQAEGGTMSTPFLTLAINDDIYVVKGSEVPATGMLNAPYDQILSYHDYRAQRYMVTWGNVQSTFVMKAATANNIAYFTMPSTDEYKYPSFRASSGIIPEKPIELPSSSDTLHETNRVQVTADNNCFNMPFDRSYSIGSSNNRIIAMQSAAIKIGDEQVGALPLYVFTTEGIYALRAGENTLYAAVNPVNYDKIINPNTLAINGGVVYITERGVHIISGEGSQIISTPIHQRNGIPDMSFFKDCSLFYGQEYNEVILHKGDKTFVYNLEAGYWSTRDLEGTKLNTDELYAKNAIYDLSNEDEAKPLPCSIATRSIKLGNVQFKRLETIIPRISSDDNYMLTMDVSGAVNGASYLPLREVPSMEIDGKRTYPFIVRRTPFSAKYFKVTMDIEPLLGDPLNVRITNIDFEWYAKHLHRMR